MKFTQAAVLIALTGFSTASLAELQFNADMPWTTQDVENTVGSGGGGGSEPAAPDTNAWVTFANTHCGKSYADFAAYEADSGILDCTFTDADVTTNFPDRASALSLQFNNGADVTNMDFMATVTTPDLIQIQDDDGNLTDISGLSNITTLTDITLWSGSGITDLSPLDGIVIENSGTVLINYGSLSASSVPAFGPGSNFRASGTALSLCDGLLGCSSAGSLTDVSGLANVDPSLLAEGGILLYNTNYAVKAPANSTFCTNWTTDVVWQANYTPVTKSNVCAP